jgi:cell division protein FtsI (penicillin-binding protein 3)
MSNLIKWRFYLVVFTLAAAALVILASYALIILRDDSGGMRRIWTSTERGKILDRNGKILASQITLYNLYVSPPERDEIPALAEELAAVTGMNAEDINNRIRNASGRLLLQRQVPESVMEIIRAEQRNDRLKGVTTSPVTVRVYPEKNLAAQIIGFTGADNIGREGIEYAFNKELSAGNDVVLTIDINVQHILESVAGATLNERRAESVLFLAMDPRNGDILGSAVLPGYDPNDYRASSSDRYLYLPAHEHYEPGSVFKSFSISALMDSGVITENSEFFCNGVYERTFPSGETIRIECADGNAHGRVRPREIIIHSCNVGASYAADQQENQLFYQKMTDYGFGKRTGAWVNTETAGLIKPPNLWSGRTKQSIAFGQEIAVSALQIMQAATVIANNGLLVPPKMISHIAEADGRTITNWVRNNDNSSRQVINPETARKMLSYMADTATAIGTGWRANVDDLHLAVKTGTAQLRDPSTRRVDPLTGMIVDYSETDFIASCVAILPAESPSLVLYVVIIKPRGETYGGRIAAPAIREAAELLIDYLGIPRGRNPIVEHPGSMVFTEQVLPVIGTRVPNFYGLSKKTLVPLLERSDIRVEILGDGWVRRQSPPPGTLITADTVIELYLE